MLTTPSMRQPSISLVIPTYKRYQSLISLLTTANQLAGGRIAEILVIDSTDDDFERISLENVRHIRCRHKNALFQRYVGWMAAKSDWILFMDDDMEIADKAAFDKLECLIDSKTSDGFALGFVNKDFESVVHKLPKSLSSQLATYLNIKRIIGWLTGYPQLRAGRFFFCGIRGNQPDGGGMTEWLSGGAFMVKRRFLFRDFNLQMCDLFEKGLGMGEDALLGYTFSKAAKLQYVSDILLIHNDQRNSQFTSTLVGYAKRVSFSRLFLSQEYARLNKLPQITGFLYYHWYTLFRVLGMTINCLVKPSKERALLLNGTLRGWSLTWTFKYDGNLGRNSYWYGEARRITLQPLPDESLSHGS